MQKNKKIVAVVAAVMALAIGVSGAFSYFTDSANTAGVTMAGKLSVGITATGITDQLANTSFANVVQNLNPGDSRAIAYSIDNDENKAMRTNDTITLRVTPDAAYGGTFTSVADCKITLNGATLDTAASSYKDGVFTLVYKGAETILSGTGTNAEVVADHTATTSARAYTLTFATAADNAWQNASIAMNVKVDAVQYANTTALSDGGAFAAESVVTTTDGLKA